MDKQEFVDALVSCTKCGECGSDVDAPIWRVAAFDEQNTEWLGVNIASCPKCGNVTVGAAGSSLLAHDEAKKIRLKLLAEMDFFRRIEKDKKRS